MEHSSVKEIVMVDRVPDVDDDQRDIVTSKPINALLKSAAE